MLDPDDPKAENVMNQIYIGKDTTKCDGKMEGFSQLHYILFGSSSNKSIGLDYKPNFEVDYKFQFIYRTNSI